MIDLHTHSTASDGTDSPTDLVVKASRAGVTTLAITDHDTTHGWAEASEAVGGLDEDFTLVLGTEFSCVYVADNGRRISLHLLGYLYDPLAEPLRSERLRLREDRRGRGEAIVDNLVAAGYPISWTQVQGIARGGAVGRPHIGQALMEAGVVDSVTDAFADMLSSRSPYYVPKSDMSVFAAIRGINDAGGLSVIAHPWARRRGPVLPALAIAELVEAGMAGIEVDHADHSEPDRVELRALAADLGAFTTGSSDYHGTNKTVRLGAESTEPVVLAEILERASGSVPVRSRSSRGAG